MQHWPPPLPSMVPVMAIAMGVFLLVGRPTDNAQPAARIAAAMPASVQTMQAYVAERRKAGVSPLIPWRLAGNTGRVVSFEITDLPDLAGQRCEMRWAELGATDQRPATGIAWQYDDVLGWPDGLFFPGEATDRFAGEIWVPEPVVTGAFLVRLRLVCNKVEIVEMDTQRFSVNLGVDDRQTPISTVRSQVGQTPVPPPGRGG